MNNNTDCNSCTNFIRVVLWSCTIYFYLCTMYLYNTYKKISSSEFFLVMSFIYIQCHRFFFLSFIRKSFHIINSRVCQKSKRILSLYTRKYNLTLSTVIEMKMCRKYNEKSQCCIRKSDIFSKMFHSRFKQFYFVYCFVFLYNMLYIAQLKLGITLRT